MSIVPYGFASASVRTVDPTPMGLIVDQPATGILPDDYLLRNGQPWVPPLWVRAISACTADGTYYHQRISPLDIQSSAGVRFVATDETWDDTAFVWSPTVADVVSRYQMDGDPLSSPLLLERDWRIDTELLAAQALVFDDSVLTSNFDSGFDDAYGFTLGMALTVREPGPIITFLDGASIWATGYGLMATVGGRSFSVELPKGPLDPPVLYLTLEIDPPRAVLTVGSGPSKLYQGSSSVAERTTSFIFTLSGRFDLFSLDIWLDDRPSPMEIFAGYSSALGAS